MANVKQAKLDFIKGYGENYRKLRKSKGLTLEELGKIIHYSDKTINNIETEQRTPTIEQLKAYHNYFGTSYEYLLGETTVNDICLQDICEYTKLKPESINSIKDSKYHDIIDSLISSPEFNKMLDVICESLTFRHLYNKIDGLDQEIPSDSILFMVTLAVRTGGLAPYYKQQLHELLDKCLDRLIQDYLANDK